jgi:hypothetical protein
MLKLKINSINKKNKATKKIYYNTYRRIFFYPYIITVKPLDIIVKDLINNQLFVFSRDQFNNKYINLFINYKKNININNFKINKYIYHYLYNNNYINNKYKYNIKYITNKNKLKKSYFKFQRKKIFFRKLNRKLLIKKFFNLYNISFNFKDVLNYKLKRFFRKGLKKHEIYLNIKNFNKNSIKYYYNKFNKIKNKIKPIIKDIEINKFSKFDNDNKYFYLEIIFIIISYFKNSLTSSSKIFKFNENFYENNKIYCHDNKLK